MAETHLSLRDVHAWYGESHVLHGVDFDVRRGEVVTVLGRNGAGRTTMLRAIMGLVGRCTGSVRMQGAEIVGAAPHKVARHGIGYCPEERGIFAALSCEENLLLPPVVAPGGMSLAQIFELFPNLLERRHSPGTRLSGGEQQMLALGRILRTGAKLLLLDEISEGLAPVIVQAIGRAIGRLREQGFTVVMVEQNFRFAAPLADRFYVMEGGRMVESFGASQLPARMETLHERLGV
ncbi:MAG: ABC transporter ATP-binding protein [Ramlibacter sp.]|nr:ABC transporter ATP-binding protein [Ramlibacter sp.]